MKKPQEAAHLPDTSTWLTRYEAAQLMGIEISTVIADERRRLLHPRREHRRDTRGAERSTLLYDPAEVVKLPRRERVSVGRSAGETTARAWELFREGRTIEEVVIELRETFERIVELREKWLDAGGAARVLSVVAWEAIESVVGPFASVTELVEKLQQLKPAT